MTVSGVGNGAIIDQWTCFSNYSNQRWYEEDVPGTGVRIKSRGSGKCLTVHGGGSEDGAYLDQWDCLSNHPNQQWSYFYVQGVYYRLIVASSNKCATLDLYGDPHANGTQVFQWGCIPGSPNQKWYSTTPLWLSLGVMIRKSLESAATYFRNEW